MFSQFKRINNESGIVLFIVLMTAIIIMIFSVGILTQSMNEINYAQQQIDQITSDQLTKGIFWNAYSSGPGSSYTVNTWQNESGQDGGFGRNYVITMVSTNTSPAGIITYNTTTSYDTF